MKSLAAVIQDATADPVFFLSLQNNSRSQTVHKVGSGESKVY